jgi:3-oxoacyl-[acyl-carrier protein] reductase
MDLQLKGKTALVTGASIGIGRGIALGLAREGVRLALMARRGDLLEAVAGEITSAGGTKPVLIVEDFMQEGAPERIARSALEGLGAVDILVNNAGGSRPFKVDASDEQWNEALTLNFTRQRQLTHRLLDQMMARKWGRILNITGKSEPDGINGAFCAKAAIHSWAKGLSRDVGKYGITVNSLPPGRINSEQIRRTTRFPSGATASRRTWPTSCASWPRRWRATSPAPSFLSTAGCGATSFEPVEILAQLKILQAVLHPVTRARPLALCHMRGALPHGEAAGEGLAARVLAGPGFARLL